MRRLELGVILGAAIAIGGCGLQSRPSKLDLTGPMDTGTHMVTLTSKGDNPDGKPDDLRCFTSDPIIIYRPEATSGVGVKTTNAECHRATDGAILSADHFGIIGSNPFPVIDAVAETVVVQDNPWRKIKQPQ